MIKTMRIKLIPVTYFTDSNTCYSSLVCCRAVSHYCKIVNGESMFAKLYDHVDAQKRD